MFEIHYKEQEKQARKLLLENKLTSEKELALMTRKEIEDKVNKDYIVYNDEHDDFLLVPAEKEKEFDQMVTWIRA